MELRSVVYPMGFPLEIVTNSRAILAAASQAWVRYPSLAPETPIRLHVTVSHETSAEGHPPRVAFEGAWMYIRGAQNHARANLSSGQAEIHVTADTAADTDYLNYHFLKPLAYLLLAPSHFAFVHASCIALNERALLLCGDAFAGKTCLAFACARKGWTFLSGDATHLLHRSSGFCVAGRPFSIRFRESARELFPELDVWPVKIRPNQKPCIEVDTSKLNLVTAFRAPASHIVFLRRTGQRAAKVTPISQGETERRLNEAIFFGDEEVRRNQRSTLLRFSSLPAVRLEYSDLDEAEAALRALSLNEA